MKFTKIIKSLLIAVILYVSAYVLNLCLVSWAGPLNGVFCDFCNAIGVETELGMLVVLADVTLMTLSCWIYGVPELIDTWSKRAAA